MLFDFAAAFPSVLKSGLLAVLYAINAPLGFINTFISMYSENNAYTRNQGECISSKSSQESFKGVLCQLPY